MSGIDDLNNAASNASGGLNDLQRATQSLTESERQQIAQNEKLKKTLLDLATATTFASGEFSKWSKASTGVAGILGGGLEEFGKKLSETAKSRIGRIAGGISQITGKTITGAGDLASAALTQQDNLVKAYRGLSEFGAIDSSGIEGLQETLADIGTTAENVGYFRESLASVAPQLAIFGGTVAEGAKQTTNLVKGLLNAREQFEGRLTQFGYSTEDIMKYSSTFISLNSRNMQGLTKDSEKLKQATYDYMKDLSELAELTGNSRDQQVAAQKSLQNEVGWREKLRQLAEEGGEDGKRQADRAETFMRNLELINPALAKAQRDFELHGAATTEETAKTLAQYPKFAQEFHRQISSTESATTSFAKILATGSEEAKQFTRTYGRAGTYGDSHRDLALTAADYNMAQMNAKQLNDAAAKIGENTKKIEAQSDDRLRAQTELQQRGRMVQNTMQDAYFVLGTSAVASVNTFMQTLNKASLELIEVVKLMPGGDKITGKQNRFVDADYVTSSMKVLDLQKQRAQIEKEVQDLERKKAGDADKTTQSVIDTRNKEIQAINDKIKNEQVASTIILDDAKKQKAVNDANNLVLKSGVQMDKSKMNPDAVELMNRLQQVPGFKQFTSTNEPERQRGGNLYSGMHASGQAFDATFSGKNDPSQRRLIDEVVNKFKRDTGAQVSILDEYGSNRSKNATGGHYDFKVLPSANSGGGYVGGKLERERAPTFKPDDNLPSSKSSSLSPSNSNFAGNNVGSDQAVSLLASMNTKLDSMNNILDRSLRTHSDIAENTKHTATALG